MKDDCDCIMNQITRKLSLSAVFNLSQLSQRLWHAIHTIFQMFKALLSYNFHEIQGSQGGTEIINVVSECKYSAIWWGLVISQQD